MYTRDVYYLKPPNYYTNEQFVGTHIVDCVGLINSNKMLLVEVRRFLTMGHYNV
jgi:hypothetical protein